MKDLLDVHMHTLASGHAYSTPREMVAAGRRAGLAESVLHSGNAWVFSLSV